METKDVIILAEEGTDPQYLSSGHVLYARESTLFSLRLDTDQLQPVGQPTPVEQQVLRYSGGSSQFSVSSNGVFAHIPTSVDSDENRALIWVDTNGDEEYVGAGYGAYQWLSISPDGVKIAATRYGVEPSRDVWIWDTESLSTDRRTFGEDDFAPVWSVDGSTFAFASGRSDAADRDIYVAPQNGSAEATVLYAGEEALYPVSRAPDGSIVVLRRRGDFASDDLLLLDAEGQSLEVIVATEFDEANASLSPDGQWLAYTSNESGQEQVIVRHFPGPSGRWAVSPPGGTIPNWSPNGLVVYYEYRGSMWAASLDLDAVATVEERRELFSTAPYLMSICCGIVPYDVHPDTGRFLMIANPAAPSDAAGDASAPHIVVVLNWFEELKQRVPTGR